MLRTLLITTLCFGLSLPKEELQRHYPFDRATGYSVGELRGAISIKQPLDIPWSRRIPETVTTTTTYTHSQ